MLKKGLVGYAILLFVGFILVSLSIFAVVETRTAYLEHQRETRIAEIYEDLELDDTYRVADVSIFGEKKKYSWDEERTHASVVSYGRDADRSETFDDIQRRLESAGFRQIESPDYGNVGRQDHYTNDAGEFVRVSVDTVAWHNAMLYGTQIPNRSSDAANETGPVYVTIKVNLDDNNE